MRRRIFSLTVFLHIALGCFAQSPQAFSYQAIVLDGTNKVVANSSVSTQISILQGSASGVSVYVETHALMTNDNGLISTQVGTGVAVSGDFETIDWASGPYFIKTETDPEGGTNYTITSTNQMLSVPYALHAKSAESIIGTTQLAIGDSYGGGIIFWLDESGQHGLIAATADQSTGVSWHNGSQVLTETTLTAIYAGEPNTNIQVEMMGSGNYAAQVCADYSVIVDNQYYDDWYLPSKYELNLLYQQRNIVGGFADAYYWSSTEIDLVYAWRQSFGWGGQGSHNKGFTINYVRAIRAF